MTLGGEIIDLVRLCLFDDADEISGIGEIAKMKHEVQVPLVGILVKMVDAAGIKRGGAAFNAVNYVIFFEKQVRQICAISTGDSSD